MINRLSLLAAIITLGSLATGASAHVVVKPNQANVGQFQTFTMGVPVEKEMPTTSVRLVIPTGLQHVTPNVKPGWRITATDTDITWSGGSIPAGQRDDFTFSAQVPAAATTLSWKAYQTYQDGTVVAWDQPPSATHEDGATPYSETTVINDLQPSPTPTVTTTSAGRNPALTISLVALVFSIIAFSRSNRKTV